MSRSSGGAGCPFCSPEPLRVIFDTPPVLALWDAFPVTDGHALVVPHRHVSTWFEASEDERIAIIRSIDRVKEEIERSSDPAGYNIGMNVGAAAGQTIPHLHVHVIPRYPGDMPDPRGGVRHVIPEKGNYLLRPTPDEVSPRGPALVQGGSADPLLPYLLEELGKARAVDVAVAFVLESGVHLIEEHLQDLLDRGGRLRLLAGDYFGITEPAALLRLLDLQGKRSLRVFESRNVSFHPKAYLFHGDEEGIAFIGSSNLTQTALSEGVEWNYRVIHSSDQRGFEEVVQGFQALWENPKTRSLSDEWIQEYERRRTRTPPHRSGIPEEPVEPPKPHSIQTEALAELKKAREAGNTAGLVVLATGLGKTWLSAFDSESTGYERVLFVAHREEILRQAMQTFRTIRPLAKLGYYMGPEKSPEADVLFASIQTLSREGRLGAFESNAFDYVVIDEFHHASADTYRRVIGHFEPEFLLGLTATPERTDGADLLALCGDNLVYRADLPEGIRRGLLSPFNYFGVPDLVDYEKIPWRSSRFDEDELTQAVATQERALNAFEQLEKHGQSRTVAFCVSQRHADFMAEFFSEQGLRAAAVHAGDGSAPRARSLERLEAGELDVICAVDMFNEGIDLPHVDTILMLRPTESRILWLQQFGRGLRKQEGKVLHVIDYIGNHRVFLTKIRAMFDLGNADREVAFLLDRIQEGKAELPPGCSVTYDLEVVDVLRGLLRSPSSKVEQLEQYYDEYRELHNVRPLAREVHYEGYDPLLVRRSGYESWLDFVTTMGDLSEEDQAACDRMSAFIRALETTPMNKSYKMLVLQAMLDADSLPGSISLDALTERVGIIARRYPVARQQIGTDLDDPDALQEMLRQHPIRAWVEGRGTGGTSYFRFDGEDFSTKFSLPEPVRDAGRELLAELVEWRLAKHMDGAGPDRGADEFLCQVVREDAAGTAERDRGDLVLRLPDRNEVRGLPRGWRKVRDNGTDLHAWFEDTAIRVIAESGSAQNILSSLLEGWFGPGQAVGSSPGVGSHVLFRSEKDTYVMRPTEEKALSDGPVPWARYSREEAMRALEIDPVGREMQLGIIRRPGQLVLFVTLDKSGHAEEFQYDDGFLSPGSFVWESQNRNTQAGRIGQDIQGQQAGDTQVRLFVRRRKKMRGESQPFYYGGELEFEQWEGEKPIKVWWKLGTPVPEQLRKELGAEEK